VEAIVADETVLMQEYWIEEARLLRRHGTKLVRLANGPQVEVPKINTPADDGRYILSLAGI
jgi:hypothetical protein